MSSPRSTLRRRLQRLARWCVRASFVVAGVLILYHEVVRAEASWARIFLGLWLIGVPPAAWLDTLRIVGKLAEVVHEARPIIKQAQEELERDERED